MGVPRETKPAFFRLVTRRLVNLTNTELAMLFKLRAAEVEEALTGHVWWDCNKTVYWSRFMTLQDRLYEVMMEIQSRYPAREVREYNELLPVKESE